LTKGHFGQTSQLVICITEGLHGCPKWVRK